MSSTSLKNIFLRKKQISQEQFLYSSPRNKKERNGYLIPLAMVNCEK